MYGITEYELHTFGQYSPTNERVIRARGSLQPKTIQEARALSQGQPCDGGTLKILITETNARIQELKSWLSVAHGEQRRCSLLAVLGENQALLARLQELRLPTGGK